MTPSDTPAGRYRLAGGLMLLAALGVELHLAWLARGFELDDALIYHRFVRHALDGLGLVYNPGEAYNALTSPLYTYLSLAVAVPAGDVHRSAMVLAALLTAAGTAVLYLLFARTAGPLSAGFGALVLAASPFLYQCFGMETPLFLLLIGLCLWLFEAEKGTFLLGVAAALLVLTRSEGVFLVAALAVQHLRQGRPPPRPRDFLLPALLVGAVLAFNGLTYGALLPHTAAAKIAQGRSGLWGEWPLLLRAGYHRQWFFGDSHLLTALLLAGAAAGCWRLRRRALTGTVLLFLALLAGFYVSLNIPGYHWYYAPFYAFALFFAGAGFAGLLAAPQSMGFGRDLARNGRTRARRAPARRALPVAAAAAALWLAVGLLVAGRERLAATAAAPPYRTIGRWLHRHADPAAKLAAAEVGTLGWYSRLHVIDIVGLVSPHNARFLGERRFGAWLEVYEPDYVLVHAPAWPVERPVLEAAGRGRFELDPRFSHPGFALYRATGREAAEPLSTVLQRLRGGTGKGALAERSRLAQRILEEALYRPRPLAGPDLVAVNLRPDGWTRGSQLAAVAARNPGPQPVTLRLQLACGAPPAELPLTLGLDDGLGVRRQVFREPGSREIELGTLAPGEHRLWIAWSDRAWRPGGRDRRQLGVRLSAPR